MVKAKADATEGEVKIANAGSTLGESIGAAIEREVNRILKPIAEENGCIYRDAGESKKGKPTLLRIKDSSGIVYLIDSVIVNARNQPLVLIESKYIRYTKHNRDKGSWICTAHYRLRRAFPSVRKSIAVIAGSWSEPSKKMMESFDVDLYEVKFDHIVKTLMDYGVDISWKEKESAKAMTACLAWQGLPKPKHDEIASVLLKNIEPQLRKSLKVTLDPKAARSISNMEVLVETTAGESRIFPFSSVAKAAAFLNKFDENDVLDTENAPVLWDVKAADDDDESGA